MFGKTAVCFSKLIRIDEEDRGDRSGDEHRVDGHSMDLDFMRPDDRAGGAGGSGSGGGCRLGGRADPVAGRDALPLDWGDGSDAAVRFGREAVRIIETSAEFSVSICAA